MKRPSKKVLLIMLACAISLGGIWFVIAKRGQPDTDKELQTALLHIAEEAQSAVDTDSDGLTDWEEDLWGTDPKKADSDGDLTIDGDEIKERRDPKRAGPDDKLSATSTASISASTTEEELTRTDIFAREFFGRYVEAKQIYGEVDAAQQTDIVKKMLSSESLKQVAPIYSIQQLKVTGDESIDAHKAYGNALGRILIKNTPPDHKENEFTVFERAVKSQNKSELVTLDPVIAAYEKLLKDLVALPVPESLAGIHHNYVNVVSAILFDIKAFRWAFEDPINGYVAVSNYHKDVQYLVMMSKQLQQHFISKGITFEQYEDGYVVMRSI